MPLPEHPSFGPKYDSDRDLPPLAQDLTELRVATTRIGKVYDHLLGHLASSVLSQTIAGNPHDREVVRLSLAVYMRSTEILQALHATTAYPELPNRRRLLELVEQAMPKEEASRG